MEPKTIIAIVLVAFIIPDRYEVVDDPPPCGKDVNDFLCSKLHIRQPNHNRERSVER